MYRHRVFAVQRTLSAVGSTSGGNGTGDVTTSTTKCAGRIVVPAYTGNGVTLSLSTAPTQHTIHTTSTAASYTAYTRLLSVQVGRVFSCTYILTVRCPAKGHTPLSTSGSVAVYNNYPTDTSDTNTHTARDITLLTPLSTVVAALCETAGWVVAGSSRRVLSTHKVYAAGVSSGGVGSDSDISVSQDVDDTGVEAVGLVRVNDPPAPDTVLNTTDNSSIIDIDTSADVSSASGSSSESQTDPAAETVAAAGTSVSGSVAIDAPSSTTAVQADTASAFIHTTTNTAVSPNTINTTDSTAAPNTTITPAWVEVRLELSWDLLPVTLGAAPLPPLQVKHVVVHCLVVFWLQI